MKKIIFLGIVIILVICGCSSSDDGSVTYMEAKEMLINNEAILLDVRTSDEYNDNHIDGAVNLAVDEISEESVKGVIKNKDSYVIVYCKSGVRSRDAYNKLKEMGYKNIYDLGSIDNWKE